MLDKYFNNIIIGILGILGVTTIVGLLSAGQPQISPLQTSSYKKFSLFSSNKSQLNFTSTVILGGDIMLSRTIGSDNKKLGYGFSFSGMHYHPINAIPTCSLGDCLLLMNLESPFSQFDNDIKQRTFIFKANTGNISTLNTLRGNNTMVLSLANNHINNAGGEGIVTTRNLLQQFGYHFVGAGTSRDESRSILNVNHKNITRCISAYSYDGNGGTYGGKPLYWNPLYLSGMLVDLEEMKNNIACDIKAMMLHWGREYKIHATDEQSKIARTLIDNGLDIVIGSHAHVPGTIEKYKNKYIFYSLGNALFDQDWGMETPQTSMDTIYDVLLGKETVPTYIALFPELLITKTHTGTFISLVNIHGARIEKGVYFPLDEDTKQSMASSPYVYE